jgi:hypothetical protein
LKPRLEEAIELFKAQTEANPSIFTNRLKSSSAKNDVIAAINALSEEDAAKYQGLLKC